MAHLYKSRLQNYAQKKNIAFPTYACETQGPPHSRLFKAKVTIDGVTYEGPEFCTTLKDAEHAAAKVAFTSLSPDGTQEDDCLYKSLLQELAQKKGLALPIYATNRVGPPHMPSFASTVEIAGKCFAGQEARTKKQAEMNAAKVAYAALTEGGPRVNNAAVFTDIQMVETSSFGSSGLQTVVAYKKEPALVSSTSKMGTTVSDRASCSIAKETEKAKGLSWMATMPNEDTEKHTVTLPSLVIHQLQTKTAPNVVDSVKVYVPRKNRVYQAHEGLCSMATIPNEVTEKHTVTLPSLVIHQSQTKTAPNVVDSVKVYVPRKNRVYQAHEGSGSNFPGSNGKINERNQSSVMDSGAIKPTSTKIVIRPHIPGMAYEGPIQVSDDEWVAMKVNVDDET